MELGIFMVGFIAGVFFNVVMKKSSVRAAYAEATKYCNRLETTTDWNIDREIQVLQDKWERDGCLEDKAIRLLNELKFRKSRRGRG